MAARPAWEYATNAETISGRDGGLMPLRTYQEFFTAAVNPEGRLTAGITVEGPSRWGWPALDLLGVRWFVTGGLPPAEIKVMERHGFRIVQREAYFLLWERPAPPLARMQYDLDVVLVPRTGCDQAAGRLPPAPAGHGRAPLGVLTQPTTSARCPGGRDRDQTRVEVSVRGDADGLLVLGDPWYPQWRVEVDGRPAELLRVDHAFRGVRVPAGDHRVVFTYQDRALQAGLALSCLDRPGPGRAVAVAPATGPGLPDSRVRAVD